MSIYKKSLEQRLQQVAVDCCGHDEYVTAIVRQFACQSVTEYMQHYKRELCSIQSLLGISTDELNNMTYQQMAKVIDDMLFETPSCGDGYLYEVINYLMKPLLQLQSEEISAEKQVESQTVGKISLCERLRSVTKSQKQLMCEMNVEGVLCHMDYMLGGEKFSCSCMQHFEHHGAETIRTLVRNSEQMPCEERNKIRYHLMIEPFAALEASETTNK